EDFRGDMALRLFDSDERELPLSPTARRLEMRRPIVLPRRERRVVEQMLFTPSATPPTSERSLNGFMPDSAPLTSAQCDMRLTGRNSSYAAYDTRLRTTV